MSVKLNLFVSVFVHKCLMMLNDVEYTTFKMFVTQMSNYLFVISFQLKQMSNYLFVISFQLMFYKTLRYRLARALNIVVKSVQSALSDLLTTSATHGTFFRPSTKRGLILIGLELNTNARESVWTLLIIFTESVNRSTCLSVYLIITRLRNVNLLCFFRQYRGYRFS